MNEACRIATDAFEKFLLILCCLSVASLMELAADVRSNLLAFCMVHHDLNLKVTVCSKPLQLPRRLELTLRMCLRSTVLL